MLDLSRSDALSDLWERRWGEARPIRYLLKHDLRDRWVRFHSLPDSKQYAETGAEWQELIRRHCCIIDELRDEFGGGHLMVLAQDYPRRDAAHGWTKRALPESWLWKTLEPEDEGDDRSFIRVSRPFAGSGNLTALIRLIANDEGGAGSCIVTDESLGWLYGPYPGGGDAIAPTKPARDALRNRHAEWLSARADGL